MYWSFLDVKSLSQNLLVIIASLFYQLNLFIDFYPFLKLNKKKKSLLVNSCVTFCTAHLNDTLI